MTTPLQLSRPQNARPHQAAGCAGAAGRRRLHHRPAPQPVSRLRGRVRHAPRIRARRRHAAHRLEGLVEDRPALHQGVRGRDQPQVHDPARCQQVDAVRRTHGDGWSKFDYAATAAASLAYLLQQQQDAVGLVTFTTKVQKNLPASSHPEPPQADAARAGADAARRQDRRRARSFPSWPGRSAAAA